jgi:hypothetical protein
MSIASLSRFAPPTQAKPALQAVSPSPSVHNTQRTGAIFGSNFTIPQYTNDLTYFFCSEVLNHFLTPYLSIGMWTNDSFITELGGLIRKVVDPFTARYVRSIQTIQKGTPHSLVLGQDQNSVRLATHELSEFAFKRLKYDRSQPQSSLPKAPCFEDDKRIITFPLPIPSTVGNPHGNPQLLNFPNKKTLNQTEKHVPPLLQTLLNNKGEAADAEDRLKRLLARQIRQHLQTPIIDAKTMRTLLTDAGQLQGLEELGIAIKRNTLGISRQFGIKPQVVQPSS